MMTFTQREKLYSPILVAAFVSAGLPPEWGLAIARQESAFQPLAVVLTGGDLARGGSRGLCQMSWLTAKGLGFTGQPADLLIPRVNADLAASLCKQLVRQFKTQELRDIACGYNSGKPFARAPKSTREVYAPNVVKFAAAYQNVARQLASELPRLVALPPQASATPKAP